MPEARGFRFSEARFPFAGTAPPSEDRPMRRRLTRTPPVGCFLLGLWAWTTGLAGAADSVTGADAAAEVPLRVIAYNIYLGDFWPKDAPLAQKAKRKGQFAERLALELSLYDPDIISFPEAAEEPVMQEVARRLGMHLVWFPSPTYFPGAFLSRFEIVEAENAPVPGGSRQEEMFTRHWGKVTVRLPDGSTLAVHSAHLYPRASPTNIRMREIEVLHESSVADIEAGRSVLLIGDLNHRPGDPEQEYLFARGWIDTFEEAGAGHGLTARPDVPSRRIDYILAIGPIAEQVVVSRSLHEGAFRKDREDPRSFALSDHLPVFSLFDLARKPRPAP
jgi:endonuclease/exonuclease/phosphatase family metal-dependent hydrolase